MPRVVVETFKCDLCGVDLTDKDKYSLYAGVAEAGKLGGSFSCPIEQHYGCSLEHALALLQTCIQSHLLPEIQRRQAES